jgi:hypothetical protein
MPGGDEHGPEAQAQRQIGHGKDPCHPVEGEVCLCRAGGEFRLIARVEQVAADHEEQVHAQHCVGKAELLSHQVVGVGDHHEDGTQEPRQIERRRPVRRAETVAC